MLSIITATIGLEIQLLEKMLDTLDSVFSDVKNFEWIVQDCNSDPDLIALINTKEYARVISEDDNGIYDAWNKALKRVNGDRVCFIGIDDEVLIDWIVFACNTHISGLEVLACDVALTDDCGREAGIFFNIHQGYLNTRCNKFSHPGLVFPSSIYIENQFDETYSIIGDFVFYAQFRNLIVKDHLKKVGVKMALGGVSNSADTQSVVLHEYLRAVRSRVIPLCYTYLFKRLVSCALIKLPFSFTSIQNIYWKIRTMGKR